MSNLLLDLKFTWRSLAAKPVFAATAIITLALGIGINTSVFSIVNAVLLKPLPVSHPERLVEVYTSREDRIGGVTSYPDLKDLRRTETGFSGLAGYSLAFANISWNGRSELLVGELATSNYFDVLGVRPFLGRFFDPDEERIEGGALVTVLNYRFWQNRYGGSPSALGKTLQINGKQYTIVGVAPKNFNGKVTAFSPDLWMPIMMAEELDNFGQIDTVPSPGKTKLERRGYRWLWVTGRLRDTVSLARADAQIRPVVSSLARDFPQSNEKMRITLIPTNAVRMNPDLDGYLNSASIFLLGAVGCVLLVSCINVAGMFLARASARRREIVVRLALGSGRWRLIRQLLIESISIALLGGLGGLALSFLATRLLVRVQLPVPITLHFDLDPDWRVLIFALVASIVTGMVFGLIPALQSAQADLALDLKGYHSDEGRGKWRYLRQALVVGQLALSLVLLIGSALMTRSLSSALRTDVGFEPERYALAQFNLKIFGYDETRGKKFYEEYQRRIRSLPGVEDVALVERTPFSFNISTTSIFPNPQAEPGATPVNVDNTSVGPGYFEALSIALLEGRGFTTQDRPDSPRVAVINQAMARRLWPGESPVGKQFRTPSGRLIQIVGVCADYKVRTVGESPRPYLHLALMQAYSNYCGVLVRTRGPALPVLQELRREISALDPELVPFFLTTLDSEMAHSLAPVRMSAIILGVFGGLAVFLASVGLYGVIAYSVSRRTREIGTRIALGATPKDVVKQVVFEGLKIIVVGVGFGVAGAAAISRLVQSLLYGISSVDWISFVAGTLVLSVVALAANVLPARAAARIDPMQALRQE